MSVTTYAGEKQIGDLATRVFGPLQPAQRKAAEEALLSANPQLKSLQTVEAGAILIVPQVPGLKPKASPTGIDDAAAAGVALAASVLEQYQQKLVEAAHAEQQDVKNTSSQLKSAGVKRIVAHFELQSQVSAIEKANKQRLVAATEVENFATKTMLGIQKDLKALIAKLG